MKVLAFNGSPRKEKGATDRILQQFMKGVEEAGAKAETIYLAEKKINYCSGCFNCWVVHPGKCIYKDDMEEILRRIGEADMLVYASPVYVDGVTAQMKTMMDRNITSAQPFIEYHDGHMRHPKLKEGDGDKKMVLISTCGFGEIDNFDPIVAHIKAASKNMRAEFIGALVRPMGPVLETMELMAPDVVKPVYEAFRKAGYMAVTEGKITQDLQKAASQPIMKDEEFLEFANAFFRSEIEKNRK
jgi:multimeric flavodoxin WrbA